MAKERENKVKKGQYYRARGGTSQLYTLSCAKCGAVFAKYQKDGPGALIRLYLDRIIDEKNILNISIVQEKSDMKAILCTKCDNLLGVPMIYEPENRPAYRLIRGNIHKERI